MRPGDSGSILLAGFLKELGRSNCISLKTIPEFWLASLGSWYLQPLGGRAVLCRGVGSPGFPRSSPLCPTWEPHTYLHPLLRLLFLQPPPPGRSSLLPLSQGPGWLGVSRETGRHSCDLRTGVYPLFAHGVAQGRI